MKALLRQLFDAAVAAVQPAERLPPFLPAPDDRRTRVVGAGKAAASMADALVNAYGAAVEGVVVTRYGHGLDHPIVGIEVLEAGHPVIDAAGLVAGRRIVELASAATANDRLIVLLSGGASALMESPLPGLSLNDFQVVNRELLAVGATIVEMNTVRRQLSAIKGGGLARAAAPAEVRVLAISDVPGDCIADIGSGPCDPGASPGVGGRASGFNILRRYGCKATPAIWQVLDNWPRSAPALDEQFVQRMTANIIASAGDALSAVAKQARAAGFEPVELGADVSGDATIVAAEQAALARDYAQRGGRFALISGGETTLQLVNPHGRGGRNTEYLLALTLALRGHPGIWALAADTDGIDGTQDNAGALSAPDTIERAAASGLDGAALLRENRTYDYFAGLGDLLVTGPTRTNVSDVRVVLVDGSA